MDGAGNPVSLLLKDRVFAPGMPCVSGWNEGVS